MTISPSNDCSFVSPQQHQSSQQETHFNFLCSTNFTIRWSKTQQRIQWPTYLEMTVWRHLVRYLPKVQFILEHHTVSLIANMGQSNALKFKFKEHICSGISPYTTLVFVNKLLLQSSRATCHLPLEEQVKLLARKINIFTAFV